MTGKRISSKRTAVAGITEAAFTGFALGWQALEHTHGPSGHLLELAIGDRLAANFWREHRTAILLEAKKRNLPRPLWAEVKFDGGGDHAA